MLLVSSAATWSRTADIHARCNLYFWAFAAHFFFAAASTALKTPRLLWLALASQRLPVDEERTAARHGREERALRVPRKCEDQRRSRPALAGNSFHHLLVLSCLRVDTRTLLSHTSCCSLLTWCSEQKSQPLSTKCFTRDTWDRVRFSWSLCRQLGTRLRLRSPPRPRQVDSSTGSSWAEVRILCGEPHAARMVALVSPPSPPLPAYLSIFARKLATLKSARSPQDYG